MITDQTRIRGNRLAEENHPLQSPEDGALVLLMLVVKTSLEDVRMALDAQHSAKVQGTGKPAIEAKSRKAQRRAYGRDAAHFLDTDARLVCRVLSACGAHIPLPRYLRKMQRRAANLQTREAA